MRSFNWAGILIAVAVVGCVGFWLYRAAWMNEVMVKCAEAVKIYDDGSQCGYSGMHRVIGPGDIGMLESWGYGKDCKYYKLRLIDGSKGYLLFGSDCKSVPTGRQRFSIWAILPEHAPWARPRGVEFKNQGTK